MGMWGRGERGRVGEGTGWKGNGGGGGGGGCAAHPARGRTHTCAHKRTRTCTSARERAPLGRRPHKRPAAGDLRDGGRVDLAAGLVAERWWGHLGGGVVATGRGPRSAFGGGMAPHN